MPDWFYRPLARPFLFCLPAAAAQSLALGCLRRLSRLPFRLGERCIDFLGHARPDPVLRLNLAGQVFDGPVGLGPRLDPLGKAAQAWTHFGFSFLEVGPVAKAPAATPLVSRDAPAEALCLGDGNEDRPVAGVKAELAGLRRGSVRIIVRLAVRNTPKPLAAAQQVLQLASELTEEADLLALDLQSGGRLPAWKEVEWMEFWDALKAGAMSRPVLLVVPVVGAMLDLGSLPLARLRGAWGLLLDAHEQSPAGRVYGARSLEPLLGAVKVARSLMGDDYPLIASGGIHQPAHAASVLSAGASLVQVDTGVVYSGPGLAKRINEALASRRPAPAPAARPAEPVFRQAWFWSAMMGVGMFLGSLLALWIASGRVLLPYDEVFCGLSRNDIAAVNERLLPFLQHDRISLAGVMVAVAVLYLTFAWHGVRRGEGWARTSVLLSAGAGFASFFLFLGFGYLDSFHAFVTAILFQFFIQALVGEFRPATRPGVDWTETAAWRRGQWGQLLLILHSVGLLLAGLVIAAVGIGDVLVSTDLAYLKTDLETLRNKSPRLLPLVAHDRATLGGMLVAAGLAYFLASLRGVGRGRWWLWLAFFWSGMAAYAAAIAIHFGVGYVDRWHLLPAFAGLGLLLAGLVGTFSWMSPHDDRPRKRPPVNPAELATQADVSNHRDPHTTQPF